MTQKLDDETAREKAKELNSLVNRVYAALAEATDFADEWGLEFGFSPAYGMGGHYTSKKAYMLENEIEKDIEDPYGELYGWRSSSSSC